MWNVRMYGLMVSFIVIFIVGEVNASGFFVARFGGEHGHPTTDNPTAMYYNPAGLSLGAGTRLYLDGNFAWRSFTYDRDPAAIDNASNGTGMGETGFTPLGDGVRANSGEGSLTNFIAAPFVGVATDFGVKGLGIGLSFYAPFGGSSQYDQGEDLAGFPGAKDGPQRWWAIEGTIRSVYITTAAAYRIAPARLSLGLSLNAVKSEVNTVRARNLDGTDNLVEQAGQLEGRALLNTSSWDLSVGAGLIWEPVDRLWFGVSYQSAPGFGETEQTGQAKLNFGRSNTDTVNVSLFQTLPDVYQAGVRWRSSDDWEFRLFGNYIRWSVFDSQCVLQEGLVNGRTQNCEYEFDADRQATEDNPYVLGKPLVYIPRKWDDGFAVRAGTSYWFNPAVEVFGGAGYDSSAVPDETLEPALFDTDKFTVSLGGRFTFLDDDLALGLTYTQVIYMPREIDPRGRPCTDSSIESGMCDVPSDQQRRSDVTAVGLRYQERQPDAAGKYTQAIGVLNINVQYTF
ncbi:MAG: outer membrane protein transport protein [Myxococcota bacterium]|nr:outer membrane protein transport protein [Myxococcota bacterium]